MNFPELLNLLHSSINQAGTQKLLCCLSDSPEKDCFPDKRSYLSYLQSGISLVLDGPDEVITAIFLYSQGWEGFQAYQGSLPFDLTFGLRKSDVIQRIGEPTEVRKIPVDPDSPVLKKFKEFSVQKQELHLYWLNDTEIRLTYNEAELLVQALISVPRKPKHRLP